MRSVALLLVLIVAASCSDGELRRADAARAIAAHLERLAPQHLSQREWEVVITDVLVSSPEVREVRFQVSGLEKGEEVDPVHVAYFQRGDQGWRFSRYGEGLVDLVAALELDERMHPYRGLLVPLDAVRKVGWDWDSKIYDEFMDAALSGNQREYARADRLLRTGIPDSVVAAALTEEMLAVVDWGVDRSIKDHSTGVVSAIYWVTSRENPDLICVYGRQTSARFFWLEEYEPTCREGDGRWVSTITTLDEIRARILERGAIVAP